MLCFLVDSEIMSAVPHSSEFLPRDNLLGGGGVAFAAGSLPAPSEGLARPRGPLRPATETRLGKRPDRARGQETRPARPGGQPDRQARLATYGMGGRASPSPALEAGSSMPAHDAALWERQMYNEASAPPICKSPVQANA